MRISSKVIAILLSIFCFFTSSLSVGAASYEPDILFSECFNDKVTNTIPATVTVKGKCSGVVEYQEGEKGLSFKTLNNESGITMTAGTPLADKFFVCFDVLITDDVSFTVSTSSINLISIQKNTLVSHNGRRIGGIPKNKVATIAINVDQTSATYDVYVNGKIKINDFYNASLNKAGIENVSLAALSEVSGCEVIFDNLILGNGFSNGSTECPQLPFNERAEEEIIYEKKYSEGLFVKADFQDGDTRAQQLHDNGNKITVDKELGTNTAIVIERKGTKDSHYNFKGAFNKFKSDVLVYQWDMKFTHLTSPLNVNFIGASTWTAFQFNGNTVTIGGSTKKSYSFDQWYTYAIVWDTFDGWCQYYINGKPVSDKVKNNLDYNTMSSFRFHLRTGGEKDLFYIDNIAIYGGTAPRDNVMNEEIEVATLDLEHKGSIFPSDAERIGFMQDKISYHTRSGVIYKDGVRSFIDELPYTASGTLMASMKYFDYAHNIQTAFDLESGSITIGDCTLTVGSTTAKSSSGATYTLSHAPEVKDGLCYVPVKDICENILKYKTVYETECLNGGMFICCKNDFELPSDKEDLRKLNEFLFYRRPGRDELLEVIENHSLKGVHPRLIATAEDFEAVKVKIASDATMKKLYKDLISKADKFVADPTPIKHELRDGKRLMQVGYELTEKFSILGIAYNLTFDQKYADRALIDIKAVSTFPDWNPSHKMDIGVMAHAAAIAYDWFYNSMSEDVRKAFLNSIVQNGLDVYNQAYNTGGGVMGTEAIGGGNHNPVCNGGAILLGIAMSDEIPEISAYLLYNGIRATEYVLPSNGRYGLSFEGSDYANLKNEYLARGLSAINKYFGHLYVLDRVQGMKETLFGQYALQHALRSFDPEEPGSGGRSDTELRSHHVWFAEHYDQYNELKAALQGLELELDISDGQVLLWYDPEKMNAAVAAETALDGYNPDWPLLTMRTDHNGKNAAYFAAKGNWEASGHRQVNAGTFIYFQNGVEWALDLGSHGYELYADGFQKHDYYLNRAEGHNCVVVNPNNGNAQYSEAGTYFEKMEFAPSGGISILDMKPSYQERVESYKRGFFFTDDRESLVVRDELVVDPSKDNEIYWFMQIMENAEVHDDHVILSSKQNPANKVRLDFVCNYPFTIEITDTRPLPTSPQPLNDAIGTKSDTDRDGSQRIAFKTIGRGEVNITAKLTPINIDGSDVREYDKSMYEWTIPAGEQVITPKLDSISFNGVQYSTDSHFHKMTIAKGSSARVVCKSDKFNIETSVLESDDKHIVEVITLTDKVNPSYKSRYYVYYNIIDISSLSKDGFEAYMPGYLAASKIQQPENPDVHVFDADLSTRWACQGTPTINIDLGEEKDINALGIAFHWGTSRKYSYEVRVSTDGVNFSTVYNGTSSGTTNDMEYPTFNTCRARYVTVEFLGSNENNWNNVTELWVGKKN